MYSEKWLIAGAGNSHVIALSYDSTGTIGGGKAGVISVSNDGPFRVDIKLVGQENPKTSLAPGCTTIVQFSEGQSVEVRLPTTGTEPLYANGTATVDLI